MNHDDDVEIPQRSEGSDWAIWTAIVLFLVGGITAMMGATLIGSIIFAGGIVLALTKA